MASRCQAYVNGANVLRGKLVGLAPFKMDELFALQQQVAPAPDDEVTIFFLNPGNYNPHVPGAWKSVETIQTPAFNQVIAAVNRIVETPYNLVILFVPNASLGETDRALLSAMFVHAHPTVLVGDDAAPGMTAARQITELMFPSVPDVQSVREVFDAVMARRIVCTSRVSTELQTTLGPHASMNFGREVVVRSLISIVPFALLVYNKALYIPQVVRRLVLESGTIVTSAAVGVNAVHADAVHDAGVFPMEVFCLMADASVAVDMAGDVILNGAVDATSQVLGAVTLGAGAVLSGLLSAGLVRRSRRHVVDTVCRSLGTFQMIYLTLPHMRA